VGNEPGPVSNSGGPEGQGGVRDEGGSSKERGSATIDAITGGAAEKIAGLAGSLKQKFGDDAPKANLKRHGRHEE
ncbi:MAG: hypothetical protein ACRD30_04255, partial [Bryobacteraceae bacterium]